MLKRILDLVVSFLGLLFLLPLLTVVAILIKSGSPGPVFYRGLRAGRFGKPFRICKFRTMVLNADKIGGPSSAADDPRITRVGAFLRQYKLDELPQLLNVLRGEMSLVGPRPEVLQYVAMFTEEERPILTVLPGITDWASIANSDEGALLAGSPDPEKTYLEKIRPEKIRLQLEYVRRHSFAVDLQILMQTLRVLLRRNRAAAGISLEARGGEQ
ncbi:MAG TPA: sugar transferase [Candidatus Acidoferrum sp.]|nr:sugar transferase [Candidatus Acidoferrum sp.]